ncbi:Spo0E family sporulation regulatory protein-aspartic acid phosphatase [Clostridium lundense]|uniref:Spo0E family sporulation regulatory protein-aspartic acid phosphatase n=1 Tax=Clostridium lundense TaxID=319475 RepID=UPI000486B261|nr:Spo0E family sporulation regulatory protein-aspartic acid phosphatase [Clostridium lundense]
MVKSFLMSCIDIDEDILKEKEIEKYSNLVDIEKEIENTRVLLNEVSCDIDNLEKSKHILEVSQYMDRLLNEYTSITMDKNNSKKIKFL